MERTEQQGGRAERGTTDAGKGGASGAMSGESAQSGGPGMAARNAAAETAREVRDKASDLKSTLADKLDTGADRLRSRAREGAERVAAAGADIGAAATQRLGNASDTVATGMERTAGWLRSRDLGDLGEAIVEQVQEHPVRTLLIALGIGYAVGRSFSD